MRNNPLECGSLCWVKEAEQDGWIRVIGPHVTECVGPPALAGRKWDNITEKDLNCDEGGKPYHIQMQYIEPI